MIIARLLTPDQIGVFSVTMVLLAFLATVSDLGAGEYLVQEKVSHIRAVRAVQLGLGLILAIVVLIVAYPVAKFYEEPEMACIMLVIFAKYVTNPFASLFGYGLRLKLDYSNARSAYWRSFIWYPNYRTAIALLKILFQKMGSNYRKAHQ